MLVTHIVTCPSATTPDSPHKVDIVLPRGVITKVIVRIPPGPCGLVGMRIFKGLKQIIPFNEGAWIIGDDDRIEFEMYFELDEEENTLTVECYNFDVVYDHSYYFYFNILPPEIAYYHRYLLRAAYYLRNIFYIMIGRYRRRPRRRR